MSAKIKITLKKLKGTDHVYHRESGIILQSSDDRTAIGRYENDTPIYSQQTANPYSQNMCRTTGKLLASAKHI